MKKVIFLDIDGVVQPYASMNQRGNQDAVALRKRLAVHLNPEIAALPAPTVRAVYEDWHKPSLEHLLTLLRRHEAVIIISSSWRECETLHTLRTIFSIQGLDSYIAGTTPIMEHRVTEVSAFLAQNPSIEQIVIFDDDKFYNFEKYFPYNFVHCPDQIGDAEFARADQILSGNANLVSLVL